MLLAAATRPRLVLHASKSLPQLPVEHLILLRRQEENANDLAPLPYSCVERKDCEAAVDGGNLVHDLSNQFAAGRTDHAL